MAQNQRPVTKAPTKAYGNSPRSLASGTTPTDEADDGLAEATEAFLSSQAAAAPADDGLGEVVAQETAEVPEQPGIGGQLLNAGGKVLSAAGQVLDYGGGAARTLGYDLVSKAMGKPVVTDEDAKAALRGKAPSSSEYLRRMGVPEGGSLNFGGQKVTARGAAGLASDVLTDPLTAAAKLVKNVPYMKKLFNAPGAATEALGEAVYKSAVSGMDAKLAKTGSGSIGKILIEEGAPVLGPAGITKKIDDVSRVVGGMRQGLYDKAFELGAYADTTADDTFKHAQSVIDRMWRNPNLRASAMELQENLNKFKMKEVPLDTLSEWKTSLYDALPSSAFGGNGRLKGAAKQFKAALASDMKRKIEKTGNLAEKGLGDAIERTNAKWGTLLEAQKHAASGAPAGGKLGALIDGAILAGAGPSGYVAKKGFDLATGTAAKTIVGKSLMRAGQSGAVTGLTNRAIVNSSQPNYVEVEPEE